MAVQHFSSPGPATSDLADLRQCATALVGNRVTLRLLRRRDAPALLAHLNSPATVRFAGSAPASLADMQRFIAWTQRVRRQGRCLVYGVVPSGESAPVGVAQLRKIETDFSVAELGFVLGDRHWGRGLFVEGAGLMLDFAFGSVGVHRIEARVAEANGRAHAAMRKIGATREAVLCGSCRDSDDGFGNHVLWSLLAPQWRRRQTVRVQ